MYYILIFFVAGLFFGSFFGVVGSRLSEGKSIIYPRSHCESCGHVLEWYELIPVFSYVFQKGKCTSCGVKLSIMYPLIEIITSLLFSVSFYCFGFSRELIIALVISSYLCIVIVSDVNYYVIPDEVTAFFCVITVILKLFLFDFKTVLFSILSGTLLFCLMYCIMLIGNRLFKKETLGGADIKLMAFVGLILSPSLGIFNIFVASVMALPISIYFLIKKKDGMIPFGPFLLASLFLIYFFN
ncbi:MAG: prepilin peptidase [bacterium]|nr:prepilin peptidase [bacterium]